MGLGASVRCHAVPEIARWVVIVALLDQPAGAPVHEDQDEPAVGLRFGSDDHRGLGVADDLLAEGIVSLVLPGHDDEVWVDSLR